MFKDISMSVLTPSEANEVIPNFLKSIGFGGVSAFHETIAKDFFKNHKSELKVHVQETLQKSKREITKGKLVPGEYEMKITCLQGKFEFVYEMFDREDQLFEKRRTTYKKKGTATDTFIITVRDEHSPASLKITIKEKGTFFSGKSRFEFIFKVIQVRHHLVKQGMWQIAKDVKLGEGACASVFLGMNNLTGNLMAVKVCNLSETGDPYTRKMKLQQLEEEIETMKILKHPNIVRYLGMERKEQKIFIFMDFISGGSIEWMLSQFSFSESLIQGHTKQVLKGLSYLHEREILHRDIKCSNILYDEAGRIYLTDFGSSKKYTMDLMKNEKEGLHGTPQFMAPEVWKHRRYSTKSDIWSLACTIFQMITANDPWEEYMQRFEDNPLGFINFMGRKIEEEECVICNIDELNITEELKHFLKWCFNKDPKKRPSVKQLLRHAWFDQSISTPATPMSLNKLKKPAFDESESESSDDEEEGDEDDEEKKGNDEIEEEKITTPKFDMTPPSQMVEKIDNENMKIIKPEDIEVPEKEEKEEKEEDLEKNNNPMEIQRKKLKELEINTAKRIGSESWKALSKKGVKERILAMKTRRNDDDEEEEEEEELKKEE